MELPKSKMTIAVGAVLAVAAIAFVVHVHNAANAAQAATTGADAGTGFPTLLYTSGAGASGASTISTGGGIQSDPTTAQTPAPDTATSALLASLQATLAQIGAGASETFNTNYTDLFAKLPDTLGKNNLDALDFSGTQGKDGTTSLIASVHYRDNAPLTNYTDVVAAPPPAAEDRQMVDDFLIAGTVFSSPAAYIDWGLKLGQSPEGLQRAAALATPRRDPIGVAKA